MKLFDIFYREYDEYYLYPINRRTYLKIFKLHSNYLMYFFKCDKLNYYASNDKVFPMDIYEDCNQEKYLTSIHFNDSWTEDKIICDKQSGEKSNLKIVEYEGFRSQELICKKDGIKLFELTEQKSFLSDPKITVKGNIEGNELELFISLLCFIITNTAHKD